MLRFIQIFVIFIVFICNLKAQEHSAIYINEFLASNVSIDADMVDFDDYSDWIELYNAEDADVDIIGYFITDDLDNPYRWQFTESTIIPAKGFLRVWADGYDYNPGKHLARPYPDQNGDLIDFETQYHHLNFSLSRAGEQIALFRADSSLTDSVSFSLQQRDVSMGRQPDGSDNWFYFGEPTAGASNTTAGVSNIEYAESPEISRQSGFFSGGTDITINASSPAAQIRYTTDGSKPASTSLLYETPVNINTTTAIRARVFEDGKLPGPVITRTYFIDEDVSIPVIAITSAPAALFNNTIGIYDNNFKGREIPVHFELFEDDGLLAFNINAGLRLSGQLSLWYDQKSFTISTDERYGKDIIDYQLFPKRKLDTFTSIYLRNSGLPDNQNTFFRDALIQSLVFNKMDIDGQAYRPAVVFINGEYWGIYNIRDKIDTDYISSIHNLNPDNIDMLEYNGFPNPDVMEGEANNYTAVYNYIKSNSTDLSVSENYDYISNWIDIDEYINYMICEIFADNIIWLDQNVRMWRERKENKKWRWILFDTDYGFGMPNELSTGYTNNTLAFATNNNTGSLAPPWATIIFRKLLANSTFKNRFLQKFSVYLNTIFQSDSVLSVINRLQDVIRPEMQRHINHWRNGSYGTPIQSYNEWLDNVNVMKTFGRYRPQYQRQQLVNYFGLSGMYQLTLKTNDSQMGGIKINDNNWTDRGEPYLFFKDVTLELEAIPKVGYRFIRWQGISDSLQNPVNILPVGDTLTITALFEPVSVNLIPALVSTDTILNKAQSPYYTSAHVIIDSNVTLQVDEGVELLMAEDASIFVNGRLLINGSDTNPVTIKPNEYAQNWGAVCFVNSSDSSVLSNVIISGASKGVDFSRDRAAVSGYNSRFALNNVTIKNSKAPVFAQFGRIAVINCNLSSDIAGDLINIKYADYVLTENCILQGNDAYDSDAIDYDQIENGIIRGNRIYNFYGFNSDAIDLGEGSHNILIENNVIYNVADKGISIGHGSTAVIKRNLIANCDMGIGLKDFNSFGYVEHNTFYDNNWGIACYEKNIGAGGASAEVVNSIIGYSKSASLMVDALSHIDISYSLSNTDDLGGLYTTFAEPGFINNLYLSTNSMAIDLGNPTLPADPDNSLPDLGAFPYDPQQSNCIISEIHYNPANGPDFEFIEIVNAGQQAINLSGFQLSGDIRFTFPEKLFSSGEYIVVAKNATSYSGHEFTVFQWDDGQLPDGPGYIELSDNTGKAVDFVNYDSKQWWPRKANGQGPSLELHRLSLENMVSGSWRASYSSGGTPGAAGNSIPISGVCINEFLTSNSTIHKDEYEEYDDWLEIFNASGSTVNVGGLYLTDDFQNPAKFLISWNASETTIIEPGGFLLFWIDGQPAQGILHSNFRLDREGEQIGLVQITENDTLFLDSLSYGEQQTDISYGRYPDGGLLWQLFNNPSPGDSNKNVSSIADESKVPLTFALLQNYPNPFNNSTVISYQLPKASDVELSVYNILGQKVAMLVNKKQSAGHYSVQWEAKGFASGVYFYHLQTSEGNKSTRKLLLLK